MDDDFKLETSGSAEIWAEIFVRAAERDISIATDKEKMTVWFSKCMAAHENWLLRQSYPKEEKYMVQKKIYLGEKLENGTS